MYFKTINSSSKGFTLVEIIVTLVAAGILGAIFIQYMGTALDASWNAVEIVRDESNGERLMEQIIADYVEDINKDLDALGNIVTTYDGQTFYDVNVTTQYIVFDGSGNEVASVPGDNLKVVLQSSGPAAPAITGRYPLTIILTNSRTTNDPIVLY
jgi:prepilin-type N-terminal cleavage/methylation domain-containing protein